MNCVWQDVGYQNTDFESSYVLIGYENQMPSKVMQKKTAKKLSRSNHNFVKWQTVYSF